MTLRPGDIARVLTMTKLSAELRYVDILFLLFLLLT